MESELISIILKVGAVCAAIAGTTALAVKVVKTTHKVIEWCRCVLNDIKTLLEHDKIQHLAILRLTMVNKNLPLSERIFAGKEYVESGGNGYMKNYYEEHLKPLDEKKEV